LRHYIEMVARRNGWLANDKTDGFYLDLGAFKPLAGRHRHQGDTISHIDIQDGSIDTVIPTSISHILSEFPLQLFHW